MNENKKVIIIRSLDFFYPDGRQALKDIDLDVFEGETLGIIGANGGPERVEGHAAAGGTACRTTLATPGVGRGLQHIKISSYPCAPIGPFPGFFGCCRCV